MDVFKAIEVKCRTMCGMRLQDWHEDECRAGDACPLYPFSPYVARDGAGLPSAAPKAPAPAQDSYEDL